MYSLYFREAERVCGLNKKWKIFVNLEQFNNDTPFNSMSIQIFWIVKRIKIFQNCNRKRVMHSGSVKS